MKIVLNKIKHNYDGVLETVYNFLNLVRKTLTLRVLGNYLISFKTLDAVIDL